MILRFGFGEPGVAVEVPDRETGRAVGGLFPHYLLREDGGEGEAPARLTLRRRDGRYRIEGGALLPADGGAVTVEDRTEALARIEIAVTRGLLALRSSWPHLHASGAAVDGSGVLALGPAASGKSSLALAWSAAGRRLLGDDAILVDPEGRARPFRRLLKVDPDRLREHGFDPEATPHWSAGWSRAWFDPAAEGGGWCREPVRPRVLAFLDRGPREGPRVDEVEPAEALGFLLNGLLGTGASQAESVDPLRRLLDGARGVRLRYRESARAAELLVDLVRDSAGPGRAASRSSGGSGAAAPTRRSGGSP